MSERAQCRVCGHPIWVDETVKRGVGPVCWGRLMRGEIEDFYDIEKETEEKRGAH